MTAKERALKGPKDRARQVHSKKPAHRADRLQGDFPGESHTRRFPRNASPILNDRMSPEIPEPLRMPDLPHRVRFHRYQWIGIPLMFLIPVLALFGVFGESEDQTTASGTTLEMHVEYPTRNRYKQITHIEVVVVNLSSQTLDTLVVEFDPAYISRFSSVNFIPTPEKSFVSEFPDVLPGESRLVWVELKGEQYGVHEGIIRAYAVGMSDTVEVAVRTRVYP